MPSSLSPLKNERESTETIGLCKHTSGYVPTFYASKIQLTVDTDADFLVLPKSRSLRYFRLLDLPLANRKYNHNGAILIKCRAICNIVTSAAETENIVFIIMLELQYL